MPGIETLRKHLSWESHPVLIAEDDDNDYVLMSRAIKKIDLRNPIYRVKDGEEAVKYFMGAGPYTDREAYPIPYVLLLDLKMPMKHGLEVLEWLRSTSDFNTLVVLILSGSQNIGDIRNAYALRTNGYLVKPTTPEELEKVVESIKNFWLKVNLVVPGALSYIPNGM